MFGTIELLDWFIDLWDRLCDEYREMWMYSDNDQEKTEYMAKMVELRMQKGIALSIKEKIAEDGKEVDKVGV